MARRRLLALPCVVATVVLASLLAGCGHGASPPAGTAQNTPQAHAAEWEQTRQIVLPSHRAYALALPAPGPGTPAGPMPLVIALHGLYQLPASFASESRWTTYGQTHHIAVVYGEGLQGKWNAGSCCADAKTDDMRYLVDVLADVSRRVPIDHRRVYVVGFSNGGMMALKAVCERPDLFAGAGVMSGAVTSRCAATPPHRTTPVRVRQLDGSEDRTVPPGGGRSALLPQSFVPLAEEAAHLPAGSTLDATLVPGLAHHWANSDNSSVDATDEFWRFLQAYSL